MNFALLLAAGQGTRFGSEKPKQLIKLLGKAALIYSIETFEACKQIDRYGLIVPADKLKLFEKTVAPNNLNKLQFITAGGGSRRESVEKGLIKIASVLNTPPKTILIHDSARPAIQLRLLDKLYHKFEQLQAEVAGVIPAIPPADTVKRIDLNQEIDSQVVGETIRRQSLRLVQTPQLFNYDILTNAHAKWNESEEPTDDAMMIETLNKKIAFVEGERANRKLTHPEDKQLLEIYLSQLKESCFNDR